MLPQYARHLVFSALALAASSCAPSYMLGVKPARQSTLFASGEPQAQASADSVGLRLGFLGYEPGWIVFNAEYRNNSGQPVVIDPTGFSYAPLREAATAPAGMHVQRGALVPAVAAAASQRAPWPNLPESPLPAFNPEAHINQLQDAAAREAARANRTDWLGIALFVVAIGSDVASTGRRYETHGQAQSRAALHDIAWTYNAISSANKMGHAVAAGVMAQRAEQLSQYALRTVTLQPGQQVRGYVYLPRFDTADGLRVLAPVGRQQVPLDFVQTHQRQ